MRTIAILLTIDAVAVLCVFVLPAYLIVLARDHRLPIKVVKLATPVAWLLYLGWLVLVLLVFHWLFPPPSH